MKHVNPYLGVRWYSFDPWVRGPVAAPACYVIQVDGTTVYVGQTSNLRLRMSQHRAGLLKTLDRSKVTVKANHGRRYGDWAARELRLIRRLRPRLNKGAC